MGLRAPSAQARPVEGKARSTRSGTSRRARLHGRARCRRTAYIVRADAQCEPGGDRRPRRRARAPARGGARRSASRSRRSCSPTATSTTSAPSPRSRARRARRSTARDRAAAAERRHELGAAGVRPVRELRGRPQLSGGERLELAGMDIEVLFTPGHSPGHLTYAMGGALLSGDVLFQGSVGRVDLPGGDWDTLEASIEHARPPLPRRDGRLPGPHGCHDARARAGDQPVPDRDTRAARGGAAGGGAARRHPTPRVERVEAQSAARHLRRARRAGRRRAACEARARALLEGRGLRADRDAGVRGDRAVRARRGRVDRHRAQGDVHLRRRSAGAR